MSRRGYGDAPPIVLLIGGASGTGKSGVAVEAARRLGIGLVTSTDSIRQMMREYLPADLMPSIHYSSFEAGQAAAVPEAADPIVDGFLDQARNVLAEVEAAIARALAEGRSIVLEGVHLVPGLVPLRIEGVLVVHAILFIDDESVHRARFHIRDRATGGTRAMDKYLARLDAIRRIQDFIVESAERTGVPVIESTDPERATAEVMELALSLAGRPEGS